METVMEKNGKALVEHWDWAATKGLMNKTSARLLRTACEQVLSVEEGWENIDLGNLDVEEAFRRFQNLKGRNLAPQSLRDYKRRFTQGVTSFLDYVRDPANWKGPTADRPRNPETVTEGRTSGASKISSHNTRRKMPSELRDRNDALMDYPFPIRAGITARLQLPVDLTTAESQRLANFIASLAIDTAVVDAGAA
jgi:hypothetical protein